MSKRFMLLATTTFFRETRLRVIALAVFFAYANPVLSQQYSFYRIGTQEGLPVSAVNMVLQDPEGFFWLATEGGGAVRYDGVSFNALTEADGLPSRFVSTLFLDGDTLLWIGTELGVCTFDGSRVQRFVEFPNAPKGRVYHISRQGKNLLFATGSGLYRYNGKSFDRINEHRTYFVENHDGKLYHGTDHGLYRGRELLGFADTTVRGVTYFGDTLFVATSVGFFKAPADGGPFENLQLPYDIRHVFLEEKTAKLYIATQDNGLFIRESGKWQHIDYTSNLGDLRLRHLYKDLSGRLWLSGPGGAEVWLNPGVRWHLNTLPRQEIWSVLPDGTQRTWLGSKSALYLLENGQSRRFGQQNGLPEGIIFCIKRHSRDKIWLGTEDGLVLFNTASATATIHRLSKSVTDFFVFDLRQQGNLLWVASSAGLHQFENGNFKRIAFADGLDRGIRKLAQAENRLYALSLTGEIFYEENGVLQPFVLPEKLGEVAIVGALAVSRNTGDMALATYGNGLWMIRDGRAEQLSTPQDFDVSNLAFASDGSLWASGSDRVLRFSFLEDGRIRTQQLSHADGLPAIELNPNTMARGDRRMWLGTRSGAISVEQQMDAWQARKPQAHITSIDLFFEPTRWSTGTEGRWTGIPKELNLTYDQNYLRFRFSATDQAVGKPLDFRYKMEGLESKWTLAGKSQEAVFTNLPTGDFNFVLEVRTDELQPWQPIAHKVNLSIVPPFWKTWWFIVLMVLLVLGIVVGVIGYRFKQINRRIALDKKLANLESTALSLQMNPHFLFNALESISGFIFKNHPAEAVEYLTKFARLMRQTLENSRKNLVSLHSEIQVLKNYLALEQLRFGHRFDFEIKTDEDMDLYMVMIPPMLLQPIVENAVLHGIRTVEEGGRIEIRFSARGQALHIAVEDNGIGRQKASELAVKTGKKQGVATKITQERIGLLKRVHSGHYALDVEDKFNAEGAANGTLVTLTLPLIVDDDF